MKRIADEGRGVLIYLNQEGRGIGLANKIRAYELQDKAPTRWRPTSASASPPTCATIAPRSKCCAIWGSARSRLLSNNPKKLVGLAGEGFAVNERLPLEILGHRGDPALPEDEEGQARPLPVVGLGPAELAPVRPWTTWPALAAALVLLNASLTFGNVWPTPRCAWENALSVELAVCVLLLALASPCRARWPVRRCSDDVGGAGGRALRSM